MWKKSETGPILSESWQIAVLSGHRYNQALSPAKGVIHMPTPYAYFKKQIVPLSEAKIGVMTHAFNYGTGVFEGIRGNWNESHEQLYVFRIRDHFDRLRKSCRIMQIDLPYDNEQLVSTLTRVVEMSDYHEDVYVRPLAYKSSEVLGVRLHDLEDDLLIFVAPFGPYP